MQNLKKFTKNEFKRTIPRCGAGEFLKPKKMTQNKKYQIASYSESQTGYKFKGAYGNELVITRELTKEQVIEALRSIPYQDNELGFCRVECLDADDVVHIEKGVELDGAFFKTSTTSIELWRYTSWFQNEQLEIILDWWKDQSS